MKSVLIITPYEKLVGGVEVATFTLAKILKENNFEVDYLTTDRKSTENICDKVGIKLFGLPFLTSREFKKIKKKYDIVICNGEYAFGIQHPNAIVYFHGSYLGLKEFNIKNLNFINKLVLSWRAYIQYLGAKNKKVVTVSTFLKKILDRQRIKTDYVIGNSIDLKTFKPIIKVNGKNDFVFLGRFDYFAKGFDILETLAEKNYSITCYTDKSFTNTNLKYESFVTNEKVIEVFSYYKILLFPSRFESFGLVPAEALACGLPVLMHEVGIGEDLKKAIPEYVVTNFLNEEELNLKINEIKENYEYYSKRSRQYAEENFSLEKFKSDWLKVLNA